MDSARIIDCISAVQAALLARESEIESLDRAIGDGDHFINVKRGCEALMALSPELAPLPTDAAFTRIGTKLMMTIGGASGPLLASFFLAMGKSLGSPGPAGSAAAPANGAQFAQAFAAGVESIRMRGKAEVGEKTMLDVLIPVARLLVRLSEDGRHSSRSARASRTKPSAACSPRATWSRPRGARTFSASARSGTSTPVPRPARWRFMPFAT